MSRITIEHLKAGKIFGDCNTNEYLYLPASEIGMDDPLCVIETPQGRRDITMTQALDFVRKLSLRPVRHPLFGSRFF